MARNIWRAMIVLGATLACWAAVAQNVPKSEAPPPAPVDATPQATTANYGDWVVRCQRIGEGAASQHVCEVAQTVQAQASQGAQGGPIAQIAVGRIAPTDPLRLTLVLPPNVSFPSSPKMAVDEKDLRAVDLNWRRCLPGGCFADIEIKDDVLQHWRAQSTQGVIHFRDSTGRDIAVPFSFRGFAQALDALAKS